MKKTLTIILLAAAAISSQGCRKFLDVNPMGEVFDADMFTSGDGFEDALYGVYSELANTQGLYGAYLHWIPEACSQNVTCVSDYQIGNMAAGDWYTNGPVGVRSTVWKNAYTAINHINNIISHCDDEGVSSFKYASLYKGEALALRALVHFEIVRLFGPPEWAGEAARQKAIPYVENYSFDITPYSSLDGVYEKIVTDLTAAETLLSQDESLVEDVRTNAATGFGSARITHMNLYAVKALLARVWWTRGDMDKAAAYASEVITSGKFTFRPHTAFVQPDNGTLDLSETIFGFYTRPGNMSYQQYNRVKYRLSGTTSSAAFELSSDWKSLYEDASSTRTDYRLGAWFSEGDGTLLKLVNRMFYADVSSSYTGKAILGCNILRIPEMYYIMAEYWLERDNSRAVEYYDAVTTTRGLDPLTDTGLQLTREMLFKERRREFYGEGFTWHEMRRERMDITTFSGEVLSGHLASTYTLPIPDEEDESRNNMQ